MSQFILRCSPLQLPVRTVWPRAQRLRLDYTFLKQCVNSFIALCCLFLNCGGLMSMCELSPPPALGSISVRRPETDLTQTNTVHDPHGSAPALHCSQSYYGCCPDGRTSAGGPQGLGCPYGPAPTPARPSCIQTRYPAPSCHYPVVVEVTYGVCLRAFVWVSLL